MLPEAKRSEKAQPVNSAQKPRKNTLNQLKMLYFIPMLKDQKKNNCNFINFSLELWQVDNVNLRKT